MSLVVNNVSFAYKNNKMILDNISLEVKQGEVLGILGPNGTGKTTFLKCINNIHIPCNGTISYEGKVLGKLNYDEIAKIIAYVPQYTNNFFPMNVVDTVMMGRMPYVNKNYTTEDEKIVFSIIKEMNLEEFAFRNIKEMSGGERQRVFIARAMAQQPKIIILDEPTSSLDLYNQLFILHTITKLAKENNITIVMTIHDLNLASMFCDKILMLKDTKIFAYGTPDDVLTENNIDTMYRVKTEISMTDGYKHIRLLKSL